MIGGTTSISTSVSESQWAAGHNRAIKETATEIVLNAQQNTLLANLAGALEREFGDKTREEYYEFLKQSVIEELFK
jgi:predicted house-cleaning noncanonical NTP pyrophosphatase (MazG superfamily)